MAKTLDQFPEHHLGRPYIYPWDLWTNGEVWELTRGEDFECDPHSLRTLVQRIKKQRGLTARTRIDGDTIRIQFNG